MTNDRERNALERLLACIVNPARASELTDSLLKTYGTLASVLENAVPGGKMKLPETAHIILSMIPDLYQLIADNPDDGHPLLNTLQQAGAYASRCFVNASYERVVALCLDEEYRLMEWRVINEGGLRDVPFYPRRLLQEIAPLKAHAAVLCHNHPSGAFFFSDSDIAATRDLLELCAQIHFPLLDHLLFAGNRVTSMRSRAYLPTDLWMQCGPGIIPLGRWRADLSIKQEYFINTTLNL